MAEETRRRLPPEAFEPIPGDDYRPYVPATETPKEFTIRSVVLGVFFGIIFGAANAYVGLKIGITVTTSIPIAVLTVAFFRAGQSVWGRTSILEHNMSQTVGSASSSLASGIIFTIPALFLWGLNPSILQIAVLSMFGGLLGVLAMIPLRRLLIKGEHGKLPYPEGTACAEILVANEQGGGQARTVLSGFGLAAAYKALTGLFHAWPETFAQAIPGLPRGVFTMKVTPMFLGVGYILGYRISAIMVAGSFISAMVFIPLIAHFGQYIAIPLFPETEIPIGEMSASQIWTRYIRYLGAGGVAAGGILTIVKSFPTMVSSFRIGFQELTRRVGNAKASKVLRTDLDFSFRTVLIGVSLIVTGIATLPFVLSHVDQFVMRLVAALCIAFFAFFFVTVSSRIVGFIGVSSNPTSGMTIATLIGTSTVFYLLGWTDMTGKITALTVGTIVCTAASIAGDTSQDLKTGFLLGATPRHQQRGELIGVLTSGFAVSAAVVVLNSQYGFGTEELPAPQATLMKTVVEGILSANIPWVLVFIGALMALIVEVIGIPALPFAVGLYLPLSSLSPIFAGGLLRRYIEHKHARDRAKLEDARENGILFGSGLVAGEGIMSVVIAAIAFGAGHRPDWGGYAWMGPAAPYVGLLLFLGVAAYLVRSAQK
ncbi:MAG: oligopeptide transporter, OPT family [Candidatus Krumholzibacteriota bacterium]|nr:oligopeptide transporter, OPT family [Candidatus Krumholzibacteriota bacterium]